MERSECIIYSLQTGWLYQLTRYKYKEGDKIGPYNTVLVKRLPPNENKRYKGIFICSFCSSSEKPTYFTATIENVRNGNTRSCGCIHTEQRRQMGKNNLKDLTGQKFGKLTVLRDSGKRDKTNHVLWECQCSCKDKNIVLVTTSNLKDGGVQSCGCGYSVGENKIKKILKQLDIGFIKQKTFPDFFNPKTNKPYRFDFYLPDYNICIEYDGIQHFKTLGWNTQERLEETKKKDKLKDDFCHKRNIPLIRIPYTDFYKINENYLLNKIREVEID